MEYRALFSDTYLEHHGILGMKWGKQNGPPYPLADGRKSAAEKRQERRAEKKLAKAQAKAQKKASYDEAVKAAKAAEKELALQSGDAKRVAAIKDQLTNDELEAAIQRINKMQRLNDLEANQVKNGFNTVDDVMAKVGKVAGWLSTANNLYTQADKAWKTSTDLADKYKNREANAAAERTRKEIDKLIRNASSTDDFNTLVKRSNEMTDDQLNRLANRSGNIQKILKQIANDEKK